MPSQYKFKPRMQTTKAVSTKTKSIADFFAHMRGSIEKEYGDPANIVYPTLIGDHTSKGIPMNMKKIADVLTTALTSLDSTRTYRDRFSKPQYERAETSIGNILGKYYESDKRREGRKFIDNLLDKIYKGDAPGGLVAYRTDEGYPLEYESIEDYERNPKSGIEDGTGIPISGYFERSATPEQSPDTIAVFGDKSSWSLAPFINTITGEPVLEELAVEEERPARTLFHEMIHAGAEKGSRLQKLAQMDHQREFDKLENRVIGSYKPISGSGMDKWLHKMLYRAMMDEGGKKSEPLNIKDLFK